MRVQLIDVFCVPRVAESEKGQFVGCCELQISQYFAQFSLRCLDLVGQSIGFFEIRPGKRRARLYKAGPAAGEEISVDAFMSLHIRPRAEQILQSAKECQGAEQD